MKLLVTGGAGFIGGHIVDRMRADGHEVAILDNFRARRRRDLADRLSGVEVFEADVRRLDHVREAVRKRAVVFHMAALASVPASIRRPLDCHADNITGTLNVLLAARDAGVRRVVFASSAAVYGTTATVPSSEAQTPQPISPYAASKLAGESYCRSFWEVYGLETVALRYFNVFGPRQDPESDYAAAVPRFVHTGAHGGGVTVFGDGEQSRDFVYVGDVVEANARAMTAAAAVGGVFNIASGRPTTVNRLLEEIEALTGVHVPVTHAEPRVGEVRHSLADIGRARRDLGYVPATDLREGLRWTVAYFLEGRTAERGATPRPRDTR